MKLRLALFAASAALATSSTALAQAAPATGAATPPAAPGTAPTAGTPGAAPTGKSSAEKPKPLSSADKKFVKDATEGMYLVLDIVGQAKTSAAAETTKTLGDKIKTELDKIWADVGGFATATGETLPSELKGADKSAVERLKKADKEKWDKLFLNVTGKEMKRLTRAFESAKSLQNAELKAIAEKHKPTIARFEIDLANAEKELKAK